MANECTIRAERRIVTQVPRRVVTVSALEICGSGEFDALAEGRVGIPRSFARRKPPALLGLLIAPLDS